MAFEMGADLLCSFRGFITVCVVIGRVDLINCVFVHHVVEKGRVGLHDRDHLFVLGLLGTIEASHGSRATNTELNRLDIFS